MEKVTLLCLYLQQRIYGARISVMYDECEAFQPISIIFNEQEMLVIYKRTLLDSDIQSKIDSSLTYLR